MEAQSLIKVEEFYLEDVIAELSGLPEFLHEKDAERWFGQVVSQLRLKNCGREELAWLFGLPLAVLNDALPSSAAEELIGTDLLSIGFLPRGSGCIFDGSTSKPFLNGRKCTICTTLVDSAAHVNMLMEGGIGDTPGSVDPSKTILLARKNLTFVQPPEEERPPDVSSMITHAPAGSSSGFPPLSLAGNQVEEEPAWDARGLLGESWFDAPSKRPAFLRSPDAEQWLAALVGRLVTAKSVGREELHHFLGSLDATSQVFGGSLVPPSLTEDSLNVMLDELGFIPATALCVVEGSNSFAHLNGRDGRLLECCPDGATHAKLQPNGEDAPLQIHRKNLRLLDTGLGQAAATQASVGAVAATPVPEQPAAQADAAGSVPDANAGAVISQSQSTEATGFFGWLMGCGICSKPAPAQITVNPNCTIPTNGQQVASGGAPGQQAPQAAPSSQTPARCNFCSSCGFQFADAEQNFCPRCGQRR